MLKHSNIDIVRKSKQYCLKLCYCLMILKKQFYKRKNVYKNSEKLELAKTVEKYKRQYEEEVEKNRGKRKYDYKLKNMLQ